MRTVVYVLILALLFLAPVDRLDVAQLEPVQTIAVSRVEGNVVIQTDLDNKGIGKTTELALQELERTTPGVIYLDTAEYLLVAENALDTVNVLRSYLAPSVKVTVWDAEGSVNGAAEYLAVRKDLPKLKDWHLTEIGT